MKNHPESDRIKQAKVVFMQENIEIAVREYWRIFVFVSFLQAAI